MELDLDSLFLEGFGSQDIPSPQKQVTIITPHKCKDNGIPEFQETSEFLICVSCGDVIQGLTTNQDVGFFSGDGKADMRTMGGNYNPLMSFGNNTGTVVGDKRSSLYRLNMWMSMTYEDSVILSLKNQLEETKRKLGVPDYIITNTLTLFKKCFNCKTDEGKKVIHRGDNKRGMIVVCFYESCNHHTHKIILGNVLKHFEIDSKLYNKCYKMYIADNKMSGGEKVNICEMALNYCETIQITSSKIRNLITKIIDVSTRSNILKPFNPTSVIAGCIYFTINELGSLDKFPLNLISEKLLVGKLTIKKVSKILEKNKNSILIEVSKL
jgi:transcription initiation factor TFIIIB Brf1 subunit/transcription initiation factor TFIIB